MKVKKCTIRTFVDEEQITLCEGLDDDFHYNDTILLEKGFKKTENGYSKFSSTFTYVKGNIRVSINVWFKQDNEPKYEWK